MRHPLPPRANLEHLKKQAKDLLDAHKRGDPAALTRIRDAVPAFAGMSDEAIASAPFALHDAQSAIAREYGHKSWGDLRDAVAAQSAAAGEMTDDLLRALMPLPFPADVGAAIRDAAQKRKADVLAAERGPHAETLPLLPIRDALFLPRALGPIHVGRPASHAAVAAACASVPPVVALFAQRAAGDDNVDASGLYPVGCEAFVHTRMADGPSHAWIVLEGIRWVALESITNDAAGYQVAAVKSLVIEEGDAVKVKEAADALRRRARDLAAAFPDAQRLIALIDAAPAARLGDLIVANLPVSVEEKARYAQERELVERLRMADAMAARRVG